MQKSLDAVVAGHICLDICPSMDFASPCGIDDIFIPGKLTNVGKADISTGGAVSNTGIAMALMGFEIGLAARIGNDFFGAAVLDIMKKYSIYDGVSRDENEETSYSIVLSLPGTDRMFLHNPGANDAFCYNNVDYSMVEKAEIFHLGYPPLLKKMYREQGRELKKILKEAKRRGAATSVDMSLPDPASPSGKVDWRRILENTLPVTDIFLPSAEEIFFMLHKEEFMERKAGLKGRAMLEVISADDISRMGEELLSMGTGMCVIKCGDRGIYFRSAGRLRLDEFGGPGANDVSQWRERELWAPPFKEDKFVSAIGAGDNAVAGFLGAVLKGSAPEAALLAAAACGALNVASPDALSGVRKWEETAGMIKAGWKQLNASPGSGWKYSKEKSLWVGREDAAG